MNRRLSLLVAVLAVVSCSPRLAPGSASSEGTAFMPRPEGFAERYAREEMVILSRHNIRSPLSGPGSVLSRITPHEWFDWSSAPGELSLRGGALEMEMGQFFREWLVGEGFFAKNGVPEAGTVRFYANSIQRTRATARAFAAGMFPMADIDVEQHTPLGTMDPVFYPQITRLSDGFLAKAYAEIEVRVPREGPGYQIQSRLQERHDGLRTVPVVGPFRSGQGADDDRRPEDGLLGFGRPDAPVL